MYLYLHLPHCDTPFSSGYCSLAVITPVYERVTHNSDNKAQ